MKLEDGNCKKLGKLEDILFRARHRAGEDNNVEMYGILDNALLLAQDLGMGLKLERDRRKAQ